MATFIKVVCQELSVRGNLFTNTGDTDGHVGIRNPVSEQEKVHRCTGALVHCLLSPISYSLSLLPNI